MTERIRKLFACCQTCERIAEDETYVAFRVEFVGLAFNTIVRKSPVFGIVVTHALASSVLELLDPETREDYIKFDVVRAFCHEINSNTDLGPVWTAASITPGLAQLLEHTAHSLFATAFQDAARYYQG